MPIYRMFGASKDDFHWPVNYFWPMLTFAKSTSTPTFFFGLVLVILFASMGQSSAQTRAYVLCEGAQDFYSGEILEAPRLGTFDVTAETPVFEEIHVFEGHSFAADLILDETGEVLFVAAEDTVYKMDAQTGVILAEQPLEGARQLLLTESRVLVTRGDYDPETFGSVAFDQYLVALDREDLSWQAGWQAIEGEGPMFASEAMCVLDGQLYVGINNAFAWGEEVGIVGRVDLATGEYTESDLGPEGLNPVHLFAADGGVVSVNARQFEATSLSRVESGSLTLTSVVAETTAGCGAAAKLGDNIVFQVYGEGDFRLAHPSSLVSAGPWPGNGLSAYSMCVTSNAVLLGGTDFATTGQVDILDLEGEVLATVSTGIAPGQIVVQSATTNVAESVNTNSEGREVMAQYDVLGRPCGSNAAGLRVVHFTNGEAEMRYQLAD